MTMGRCDDSIGSARLGSARLGRSIAPFFPYVKSYLITISKTSLLETGIFAPCLRLFCMHSKAVVSYGDIEAAVRQCLNG